MLAIPIPPQPLIDMRCFFLLYLVFVSSFGFAEELTDSPLTCFFCPPQNWEMANPSTLSPRVKIAFMKPTLSGFCPSINLSIESTSVSLPEYIKAVKSIHEQDRNNHWRALGKVHTEAGVAQLTQIDTPSEWGTIRMLQLIFLKEGSAYLLTAAALKSEFSKFYKEIQTSFRSLTLTADLFQPIAQLEKKELLKEKKGQLLEKIAPLQGDKPIEALLKDPRWITFEQEVATHASDMGAYWQILVLKETQEELLNRKLVADVTQLSE